MEIPDKNVKAAVQTKILDNSQRTWTMEIPDKLDFIKTCSSVWHCSENGLGENICQACIS